MMSALVKAMAGPSFGFRWRIWGTRDKSQR
jgi:hypothetical protein